MPHASELTAKRYSLKSAVNPIPCRRARLALRRGLFYGEITGKLPVALAVITPVDRHEPQTGCNLPSAP